MVTDFYQVVEDGVIVKIHLTPKAFRNDIVGVHHTGDGHLRLRISVIAVPEKGKANQSLIGLLSKKLRLPKSSIHLIAGEQSRFKTVLFEGDSEQLCRAIDRYIADTNIRIKK
jgi:uncharacterized protein (TIGR00251 family)